MNSLDYAKAACETIMRTYTEKALPPQNEFHYHQGVFLSGMERVYLLCGEKKYSEYIKNWIDLNVDSEGTLHNCNTETLDDFQPAILIFRILEETKEKRYEKLLHMIMKYLENWKFNDEGGYWHKFYYPNQMWLDGLYMVGPLSTMYAEKFNKPELYDVMYKQMKLMEKHTRDPKTGLFYHGWDCSKEAVWSNKETGQAPEFWGRAMGWYTVAIADMLDYIPKDYMYRNEFIDILAKLLDALVKYQDEKTGMWYQVVDKGYLKENWIELSCSALFTYSISKAVRMRYIGGEYEKYADAAYNGIIRFIRHENNNVYLKNVCIGTSIGDLDYYLNRPTVETDLHGMGAFILMCTEYHKMKNRRWHNEDI